MTIHFENFRTFNKSTGYVGALCRPANAMAKTARWKACDCRECKEAIVGRKVLSRDAVIATVSGVTVYGFKLDVEGIEMEISWDEMDNNWVPLPDVEELFGVGAREVIE